MHRIDLIQTIELTLWFKLNQFDAAATFCTARCFGTMYLIGRTQNKL